MQRLDLMRIDRHKTFEEIDGLTAAEVPAPKVAAKSKIWRLAGRIALVITVTVFAIGSQGFLYQRLEHFREARHFAPQGLMARIKGGAIHINCDGSGSPSVVLES